MTTRLEIELDEPTLSWLRQRCVERGTPLATAVADQLRADALADAGAKLATWYGQHPGLVEEALTETDEALTEIR